MSDGICSFVIIQMLYETYNIWAKRRTTTCGVRLLSSKWLLLREYHTVKIEVTQQSWQGAHTIQVQLKLDISGRNVGFRGGQMQLNLTFPYSDYYR